MLPLRITIESVLIYSFLLTLALVSNTAYCATVHMHDFVSVGW